ncbi:uncharacterized protein DNG_04071 [Cephalotrichum gorgonifer]|uniref:Uncharacterized protein n=1 Tax=Cephalotrichum gorgonifer TaxID=2041049 RepID=A0AAE8MXA1_9PEZI|nr:uncharacterized protein DNG_04071 [Cephalotrichum gorgonifer]
MQLLYLLLSVSPLTVYAELNGPCTGAMATGAYGTRGTCIPTAECTSAGGHYIHNACPLDAEDIKCCVVGGPHDDSDTPAEPETQEPDTEEPDTEEPDTEEPDTEEPETQEPEPTESDAPEESNPAPEPTESSPVQAGAGISTANPIAALALGLAALVF